MAAAIFQVEVLWIRMASKFDFFKHVVCCTVAWCTCCTWFLLLENVNKPLTPNQKFFSAECWCQVYLLCFLVCFARGAVDVPCCFPGQGQQRDALTLWLFPPRKLVHGAWSRIPIAYLVLSTTFQAPRMPCCTFWMLCDKSDTYLLRQFWDVDDLSKVYVLFCSHGKLPSISVIFCEIYQCFWWNYSEPIWWSQ